MKNLSSVKEGDFVTLTGGAFGRFKVTKNTNNELIVGEGLQTQRIRRVTGYLTGSLSRFNNAKKAEVADRIKHIL